MDPGGHAHCSGSLWAQRALAARHPAAQVPQASAVEPGEMPGFRREPRHRWKLKLSELYLLARHFTGFAAGAAVAIGSSL